MWSRIEDKYADVPVKEGGSQVGTVRRKYPGCYHGIHDLIFQVSRQYTGMKQGSMWYPTTWVSQNGDKINRKRVTEVDIWRIGTGIPTMYMLCVGEGVR